MRALQKKWGDNQKKWWFASGVVTIRIRELHFKHHVHLEHCLPLMKSISHNETINKIILQSLPSRSYSPRKKFRHLRKIGIIPWLLFLRSLLNSGVADLLQNIGPNRFGRDSNILVPKLIWGEMHANDGLRFGIHPSLSSAKPNMIGY